MIEVFHLLLIFPQVVFGGDSVSLACTVRVGGGSSSTSSVQVVWTIRGEPVSAAATSNSSSSSVTTVSRGASLLESTLTVARVGERHSGQWACHLVRTDAEEGEEEEQPQEERLEVFAVISFPPFQKLKKTR